RTTNWFDVEKDICKVLFFTAGFIILNVSLSVKGKSSSICKFPFQLLYIASFAQAFFSCHGIFILMSRMIYATLAR
uniref:hypothetical protein n=1 Tax=Candidatus Fimivicinus sp. TaxID=3056640 RepID=UPI0040277CDE